MSELHPRVTVLVMTYNHEAFIRTAVDSALMQQTTFPYEVLISEDCSTDGTRDTVKKYAAENPDRVRLILSEHNVRSNEVVARGIRDARGEFIALLDGDDYWTAPHKLQKQVEFLDAHPECTICFHQMKVMEEDGSRPDWLWTPQNQKTISTIENLWMGNYIATASTMFRRASIGAPPTWYDAFFPITDWPLHLLNAENGTVGYINEVMGVYRYHSGGLYSSLEQERKLDETLKLYRRLNEVFEYRYDRLVKGGIFQYFVEWAEEYLCRGEPKRAQTCLRRAALGRPLRPIDGWKRFVKLCIRTSAALLVSKQAHGNPST